MKEIIEKNIRNEMSKSECELADVIWSKLNHPRSSIAIQAEKDIQLLHGIMMATYTKESALKVLSAMKKYYEIKD